MGSLDDSHRKICTAISMDISSIATYDWPEDWPELLPFLLKLISDQNNINGGISETSSLLSLICVHYFMRSVKSVSFCCRNQQFMELWDVWLFSLVTWMTKMCLHWYLCCFLACTLSYPLLRFVSRFWLFWSSLPCFNHHFVYVELWQVYARKSPFYFLFMYICSWSNEWCIQGTFFTLIWNVSCFSYFCLSVDVCKVIYIQTETTSLVTPLLKVWMNQFSLILEHPVQPDDPDDWSLRMEVRLIFWFL